MKTESNLLKKLLLVTAGVLALTALPLAHAVPTLKLTDGINTLTIADTTNLTGGDLNNLAGAVTYSGGFGSFFVNVSTGTSNGGTLTLDSVDISGAAGTLEISISDNFLGPTSADVKASIYGTTAGTVFYSVYANGSNSLFAPGPFGPGNIFYTGVGELKLPSNYSLTQKVVINHLGSGVTNFYATVTVPDGGVTVALLGFALVGLEGLRRMLRTASKTV